jgi:hypothetical protein
VEDLEEKIDCFVELELVETETKAARVRLGGLWRCGSQFELAFCVAMFGAVNGARRAIEAAVEPDAVRAGQVATVSGAHVALLSADGGFTAFQPNDLARVEPAGADAMSNAALLMYATLVDGGGVAMHGGRCGLGNTGLRKANGGRKCEKSNAKQRNFHGVSPWEAAVCIFELWADPHSHTWRHIATRSVVASYIGVHL